MLNSTPSSPTADSYASLERFAKYVGDYGIQDYPTEPAEQEVLLRRATRALDLLYDFVGAPASPAQALHFPRATDDGVVPISIQDATCEVALLLFAGVDVLGAPDDTAGLSEITEKVDGVGEITRKWAQGAPSQIAARLRSVNLLLRGYYYTPIEANWFQLTVTR